MRNREQPEVPARPLINSVVVSNELEEIIVPEDTSKIQYSDHSYYLYVMTSFTHLLYSFTIKFGTKRRNDESFIL